MGRFGGNFVYMAAYFVFAACSKSGCGKIQLNNAQKFVQNSSTLI